MSVDIEDFSDDELSKELKDRGILPLEIYEDHELINELDERGKRDEIDLSCFDTETLRCVLNDRNEEYVYEDPELENIYYALRDGNLENVIEMFNPLLWETIGRKV